MSPGVTSKKRGPGMVAVGVRAFDKMFPEPDPFMQDPVGWVSSRLKKWLWSKQKVILESIRDYRFTAVQSCHGAGKSFDLSAAAAWWIDSHPPGEAIVVTTAPTDHQVKAILWKEIKRRHLEGRLLGRITLEGKWYRGERLVDEELIAFGRKPQDYDADAFQGIHEKYVLVIVDEACGVPKALFDALETLITNEYSRMVAIGNPDDPASYFATICSPASDWNVIRISAFETPNFSGEFVPKDLSDRLVSRMWVNERIRKWGIGSPFWQSKVLGLFPEIGSDTLISPSLIRMAQERSLPGIELGSYGWDIARFGMDETVAYRVRGGVARLVYSKYKQSTDKTADAIQFFLNTHGANDVPAYVDEIGVGGGVVDDLVSRDLNVIPFNSAKAPFDTVRFSNRRAEAFWHLRTLFEQGKMDIDPVDEDLAAQLVSIKWGITRRGGQIYIESKEDAKKRGLPSPNRADALMMACSGFEAENAEVFIFPTKTITEDLLERVL